ncbi:hypothetical protein K8I28_00090 [bacterium]|nr:hypothetical protein [bacterium]
MKAVQGVVLFGVILLILIAGCGKSNQNNEQSAAMTTETQKEWTLADAGFETPESVFWDSVEDVYWVSNLGGPQPLDKDNNGFISKIGNDGKLMNLKWISGSEEKPLHAPKGMARYHNMLLVSDIDVLRVYAADSGEHLMDIPLPDATFANDVWAGKGIIYVTDTGTDKGGALYAIALEGHGEPMVKTVVRDQALQMPNGVYETAAGIFMVPYGGKSLFRISMNGSFESVAESPMGGLDGLIVLKDGRFVWSSWEGKAVYVMDEDKTIEPLFSDIESPADIGYDSKRNLVLIPVFMKNIVMAKKVG